MFQKIFIEKYKDMIANPHTITKQRTNVPQVSIVLRTNRMLRYMFILLCVIMAHTPLSAQEKQLPVTDNLTITDQKTISDPVAFIQSRQQERRARQADDLAAFMNLRADKGQSATSSSVTNIHVENTQPLKSPIGGAQTPLSGGVPNYAVASYGGYLSIDNCCQPPSPINFTVTKPNTVIVMHVDMEQNSNNYDFRITISGSATHDFLVSNIMNCTVYQQNLIRHNCIKTLTLNPGNYSLSLSHTAWDNWENIPGWGVDFYYYGTLFFEFIDAGNTRDDPVVAGNFSNNFQYSDTQNTDYYTNSYSGRSTNDVFYQFTLSNEMDVTINHTGTSISGGTYVYLLNSSGTLITSNNGSPASIPSRRLAAGTYYVVSEGNTGNGSIKTNITGVLPVAPGAVTPATKTVEPGGSVQLTHSDATGITSRQWQLSTNNGSSWADISGETSSTYNTGALINAGPGNVIRRYRVKINGQNTYSAESIITVTAPPIPVQGAVTPAAPAVVSGGSVDLTCSGVSGVNTYLWQVSTNDGGSWSDIREATGTTYNTGTLTNTGLSNITRRYRVRLNGQEIYSAESIVTVFPAGVGSSNKNYVQTIIPQRAVQDIPAGTRSTSQYSEVIQYFDGLGRLEQTVQVGASPEGYDIVIPVEYDSIGREARKYLPYVPGARDGLFHDNALAAQSNWYKNAPVGITRDNSPFSETKFEPSPLNRVTEQFGPGQAWKNSSRRQGTTYKANADNEVRLWTATGTQVKSDNPKPNYAAGTLYVAESTDEDNRKVVEYTDLQGRTVRQQQLVSGTGSNTVYATTDYVYDDFGRLAYVLPPAISKPANTTTVTVSSSDFAKYVYAYKYDGRGRVIEKHIPGAGWTKIVYNKLDLPVLTQDEVQRTENKWSFIKYDAHGRIVMTGVIINLNTFDEIQEEARQSVWPGLANGPCRNVFESFDPEGTIGYSNCSFPHQVPETSIMAVYYYDNYGFPAGNPYSDANKRAHGLPTGSKVRVLDSPSELWLHSALYYDGKGRVVRTVSEQLAGGDTKATDETKHTYDFVGRVVRSERSISSANSGQ